RFFSISVAWPASSSIITIVTCCELDIWVSFVYVMRDREIEFTTLTKFRCTPDCSVMTAQNCLNISHSHTLAWDAAIIAGSFKYFKYFSEVFLTNATAVITDTKGRIGNRLSTGNIDYTFF